MNYQTVSSLQFRPLLKSSFNSFHADLADTRDEKNLTCRYHLFFFDG